MGLEDDPSVDLTTLLFGKDNNISTSSSTNNILLLNNINNNNDINNFIQIIQQLESGPLQFIGNPYPQ